MGADREFMQTDDPTRTVPDLVAGLYRRESGRLTAILSRIFGVVELERIEDVVHDTFAEAVRVWAPDAVPQNPPGWLMDVARKKMINILRREGRYREILAEQNQMNGWEEPDTFPGDPFSKGEIEDSELRMIFTCCHPLLSPETSTALTLKTLCGFSVKEIASALLAGEETIRKRLHRARTQFRSGAIPYEVPAGPALLPRLDAVLLVLYLQFNEGYYSRHADSVIRTEFCAEALRLVRLLADSFEEYSAIHALQALMLLHLARFDARLNASGTLIALAEQDRSLWDRALIAAGLDALSRASRGTRLSVYHLEAGIAAEHAVATDLAHTNWEQIRRYYQALLQRKPGPVIRLNLAVVEAWTNGIPSALDKLEQLRQDDECSGYSRLLLHTALGVFHADAGDVVRARECLEYALTLAASDSERGFIRDRLSSLE